MSQPQSKCQGCGCTDIHPCVIDPYGPGRGGAEICTWVRPDLCSECVEPEVAPPLLFDANGRALIDTGDTCTCKGPRIQICGVCLRQVPPPAAPPAKHGEGRAVR